MIISLAKKELRAQAPFVSFVAFLALIDWVDLLLDSFPDQASPRHALGALIESGSDDSAMMQFLVVFALGSGLLIRDFEDRSIEFLDALPVSRLEIFSVKLGVAALALSLFPLSDAALALLRSALSKNSLHPQIPLQPILLSAALQAARLWVMLSLAICLSLFRRFAWIGLGVLYWSYIAINAFYPQVAWLNPLLLTKPSFGGDRLLLPGLQLMLQLLMSLGLTLIVGWCFNRLGDRLVASLSAVRDPRLHRFAGVVVAILTLGLCISIGMRVFKDQKPAGSVSYDDFGRAHGRTAHYRMVYPTNLSGRAERLLAVADATHDQVLALLRITPSVSATISVDATGSKLGTGGVARSSKIRIKLDAEEDLRAVLAHETTHVYIDRLSRDRAADARWGGFFHEGLASYVEFKLFRNAEELHRLRRVALLIHTRLNFDLEKIVDQELLRAKLDPDAVYPLGESFFASLIARHGDDAPLRVLRALGRSGVREDIKGLERWRDAFQAAGLDLDAAIAAWSSDLDRAAKSSQAELARFPRLIGRAEELDDRLSVAAGAFELPAGHRLSCRFRQREDSPVEEWVELQIEPSSGCSVKRTWAGGDTIWYQLGLRELHSSRAIWEPWVEVKLAR